MELKKEIKLDRTMVKKVIRLVTELGASSIAGGLSSIALCGRSKFVRIIGCFGSAGLGLVAAEKAGDKMDELVDGCFEVADQFRELVRIEKEETEEEGA